MRHGGGALEGTVTDEWLIKEAGAEGKEVGKEEELRKEGGKEEGTTPSFLPSFCLLAPDGDGTQKNLVPDCENGL